MLVQKNLELQLSWIHFKVSLESVLFFFIS